MENNIRSPDDNTKYMKEAARWINLRPQTDQSTAPKSSTISSLTSKLKSLILSKDQQDSTEDTGPKFHQFSLLPSELQVNIWTYAAQAPLTHRKNYGILSSHRLPPSSTTERPDSDPNSPLPRPILYPQSDPTQTFSSATLPPFFSLSDPTPPSDPTNKLFFPIAPLLHTCSLSRHIFQREWEPRFPEPLREIIRRTGRWVVLMTTLLEKQGLGILVLEEEVGWEGVGIWMGGRLDRREGRVVTYYLFNYMW
ncbi:hypothetical protein ONS96_004506 [Cadophora gregata f. sp. sojae]|nr:hypothetical protein ONS96_004506 [Cadophora gregata f. sp. sojae]